MLPAFSSRESCQEACSSQWRNSRSGGSCCSEELCARTRITVSSVVCISDWELTRCKLTAAPSRRGATEHSRRTNAAPPLLRQLHARSKSTVGATARWELGRHVLTLAGWFARVAIASWCLLRVPLLTLFLFSLHFLHPELAKNAPESPEEASTVMPLAPAMWRIELMLETPLMADSSMP